MTPSELCFLFAILTYVLVVVDAGDNTHPPILLERIQRLVAAANTTGNNITHGVAGSSGVVPLVLASDKQTYYTTLSVGNISFRAAVDTGSADLWLLSTGCTSRFCSSLPRYPLAYDSPSFVPVNGNNTQFSIGFADGTQALGFVAREAVQLDSLAVSQQAFALVNSTNVTFVDDVSGILGLGFPRLSTIHSMSVTNSTPFFTSLAQEGILDYPVFGVGLTRSEPWGTLALGAVDSTFVKNASFIGWSQVVPFEPFGAESNTSSYFLWTIPMSSIAVGSQSITPIPTYPAANANRSLALIDVGTEGIFGPYQDVERIFSAIDTSRLVDESGLWAIPCDTNETMTFTFNEKNYTLLPEDYLIGPVSTDTVLCLSWPQATPPSSDGVDWQLGGAFLRTVYAIFSYGIAGKEAPMIGLYPRQFSNATSPLVPPPAASLAVLFSSLSLTVETQLPNSLLATPTFTTPPYIFNTSVPTASPAQSDLAASTYVPLFRSGILANVTSLPRLAPGEIIVTVTNGGVFTTTQPSVTTTALLGHYPGQPDGALHSRAASPFIVVLLLVLSAVILG